MNDPHDTTPSIHLSFLRLIASGVLVTGAIAGCKGPRAVSVIESPVSASVDPPAADAPGDDVLAVEEITAFLDSARQDLIDRRASVGTDSPVVTSFQEAETAGNASNDPDSLMVVASTTSDDSSAREIEAGEGVQQDSPGNELVTDELDSEDGSFELDPLKGYIRTLLESASRSDAPLRQHLTLAILLAMTDPEQVFKPEGLAELTEAEQDLVRIVHEQFRALGEELEEGGDTASFISFMTELISQVEAEQPFRISRLDLCTKVQDYGVVESVDPPIFDPSERPGFIWYLELDGFEPAQDAKDGSWIYEFDLRLEMLTRDTGIPVITPIEGTVRHRATSEVRDFYLRDLFRMPSDLQFDWYTTKITVVERRTGAQAQKSADLLWVPNLAAGEAHVQRQAVVAP